MSILAPHHVRFLVGSIARSYRDVSNRIISPRFVLRILQPCLTLLQYHSVSYAGITYLTMFPGGQGVLLINL